ncbi:hypothetical protein L3Q82_009158 [Scortum barcoo]|uniref:Uncharacterized protein n=1 Tax=Scortum barcoo TaxID=214431 RepID=A0ACB8XB23_9TELE|nr:hypothetical protein L3Q82_009158 [Scortum barcoo]
MRCYFPCPVGDGCHMGRSQFQWLQVGHRDLRQSDMRPGKSSFFSRSSSGSCVLCGNAALVVVSGCSCLKQNSGPCGAKGCGQQSVDVKAEQVEVEVLSSSNSTLNILCCLALAQMPFMILTMGVMTCFHFCTHRLLANDAVVMQECWEVYVTFTARDETFVSAGHSGGPVTDTRFSNGPFYDSVVASAIFYGIVCWASSITDRDRRRRMDRLVRRASSVLGCPLDSVEVVGNGRMMAKLSSLLNNTSHPLQDTLTALGSSFSERLLHPRCVKESAKHEFSDHAKYEPHTITSEEARMAFTINHLTGQAHLWGTAEWECQTSTCSSFQTLAMELQMMFFMASVGPADRGPMPLSSRPGVSKVTGTRQYNTFLLGLEDYFKDELGNLCLYCGQLYHFVSRCPVKS